MIGKLIEFTITNADGKQKSDKYKNLPNRSRLMNLFEWESIIWNTGIRGITSRDKFYQILKYFKLHNNEEINASDWLYPGSLK